mgnify:FL=1
MNTVVKIYNITSREKPVLTKSYEMYEPYYTSRCIDNVLYVISSGNLRKEDDKIVVGYNEDNMEKEMSIDKIKYLKDVKTTKQTLISTVDLNNETADIKLDSYLMNISNAYVSENSIYLLNQKYNNLAKAINKINKEYYGKAISYWANYGTGSRLESQLLQELRTNKI